MIDGIRADNPICAAKTRSQPGYAKRRQLQRIQSLLERWRSGMLPSEMMTFREREDVQDVIMEEYLERLC